MHAERDVKVPVSAAQVRANLLDFTERRPALWPDLDPEAYEVYERGDTWARIREGSRMGPMRIWAKERYDFSAPSTVRWTVEESNFCTPGSRVIVTMADAEDGGCNVHFDWERHPTTLPARLMLAMVAASRGKPLAQSLEKAVARWSEGSARPGPGAA